MPITSKSRWLYLTILLAGTISVSGQSFSSGSNQRDGALDLTGQPPGAIVTFVPNNFPGDQHTLNIFNFTEITIPAGVTLKIQGNTVSAPIIWLASGDVDIEGTVDISGAAGANAASILDARRRPTPGPGGFSGGVGGKYDPSEATPQPLAQPGDGPTGGAPGGTGTTLETCASDGQSINPVLNQGVGGTFNGSLFLVPLVGGSGGGGGNFATAAGGLTSSPYAAGGGAGGGAILIASSTSITVNGTIDANGGTGGSTGAYVSSWCSWSFSVGTGGGGSGGGVRLAAPTISGSGTLTALGGTKDEGYSGSEQFVASGENGVIRIEAFTDSFTGAIKGTSSMGSPFSTFVPTSPFSTISVISVDAVKLPEPPTGSLTTPDATIDSTTSSTISIQATYIPVGTVITLHVFSDNSTDQTVKSTPLAGTLQSSTATATVTFPSGYSLNYVKATWSQ